MIPNQSGYLPPSLLPDAPEPFPQFWAKLPRLISRIPHFSNWLRSRTHAEAFEPSSVQLPESRSTRSRSVVSHAASDERSRQNDGSHLGFAGSDAEPENGAPGRPAHLPPRRSTGFLLSCHFSPPAH